MRVMSVIAAAAVLAGLTAGSGGATSHSVIVFNGEGNRLNAYDVSGATVVKQTVIPSAADDPVNGLDLNAQICFFPDGSRRFIGGEDTAQGGLGEPGWGIFQLEGDQIGQFSATEVGKLVPTYQTSDNSDEREFYESNPENYGCGFLSDGRVVTIDIGNQYPGTPGNGQLIVWFPPFDFEVAYCKIDVTLATPGGIHVDGDDNVYVTSARNGLPPDSDGSAVFRYDGGQFPTSNTAAGGCGRVDATGAPLADASRVDRSAFIRDLVNVPTPNAIVPSGNGTFYVSSVGTGVIAEYDGGGQFLRRVLQPPVGEVIPPFSTGSPLGLGVDSSGTLYFADLGLKFVPPPPGPGNQNGSVRRIRFVAGAPQPPEKLDDGLAFPDGIGVLELPAATQ